VIANIERVSMLFLSKTTYAFGLAIVFGIMVLPFPFLPRQESIVDGLTIGLPAFFLALMPNKQRYRPGFLKRSLTFAIPAGIVVTAALATYTRLSLNMQTDETMLRTGATLLLVIIGLWILVVLSRPINLFKTLVIGAMMIGLILVFSIPFIAQFMQLVDINSNTAELITLIAIAAIGLIEIVRLVHSKLFGDKTIKKQRRPVELTVIVILTYLSALVIILTGLLAVFARYIPDLTSFERTVITIVGAAIILIGFLSISVASGIARADRTSRIMFTVLIGIVTASSLLVAIIGEERTVSQFAVIAFLLVVITVLWTGRRRKYFKAHTIS